MLSEKEKSQIIEKISGCADTSSIINLLFKEIDKIGNFYAKVFYRINIEENNFQIIAFDFPQELNKYKEAYQDFKGIIKNSVIVECISKGHAINLNRKKIDNYLPGTKASFIVWDFLEDLFFIPLLKENLPIPGVLGLFETNGCVDKKLIPDVQIICNFFYTAIASSIELEKSNKEKSDFDILKSRYAKLLALTEKINKLMDPDELYITVIREFIDVFDFEFGFIQMEKDGRLNIIKGSVVDDSFRGELDKTIKHFGNIKTAPLINGPNGPEMACCVAYLNNIHVYFPSTKLVTNLPLLPKDRIALDLLDKIPEAFIMVPICDQGKPVGILQLWSFTHSVELNDSDIEMIKSLANFIPSVLNNAKLHSQVKSMCIESENTKKELEVAYLNLEKALIRAEEANQLKSEFLAIISHELRTPLSGMLGFSQLLQMDNSLTDIQKNYADRIYNAGHKLLGILSDLLEISVIEAGKININYSEFSLTELINDIYLLLEANFKKNNNNFKLELNGIDKVYQDQLRIRQILFNLIGNAVKFTNNGEIILNVNFKSNKYYFEIIDTGIGINPEYKDIIFDSFRQIENSTRRKYSGTGLGLSICKKLITVMNGEIGVTSEPGKGSTFYFYVPVVENKQILELKTYEFKRKFLLKSKNDFKVLIAEDDEMNSQLVKKIFMNFDNMKIKNFYSAPLLIEEFLNNPDYDLIIIDIQMPVMNGYDCLKEIRKINNTIPVIAFTAHISEEDLKAYKKAGFNDVIPKPVDMALFFETINKYIV